jgi:hypothetical protein
LLLAVVRFKFVLIILEHQIKLKKKEMEKSG